jgi:YgiT-type zinc finger domain-containing protein
MSDAVKRCSLCRGYLEPGSATLEVWLDGELVVVRDIPADVCGDCKEAYFSADVSHKLDHFLKERRHIKPERYLSVPEYSVAQFMGNS